MSLSTLTQLRTFIRKEENAKSIKLSCEQKLELLSVIENKSQKECQKDFAKISPDVAKIKERVRPVTENLTEIKIMVSKELMEKLENLKNLLSHRNKTHTLAELLEIISDMALDKLVAKSTAAAKVKEVAIENTSTEIPINNSAQEAETKLEIKSRNKNRNKTGNKSCATHNQLSAIIVFGAEKMNRHIHGL